ncbi:hypothetical protein ElyMa_000854100 [Elysia marginata]|uniref:Acyl-ACP thioesterase-like C-terminal domain-containing protein n=1 Tax=Elysia marginata TaxID=1093978 RepID=A0AAV4H120_9GAST|nr:hypothetical protein ElyMa_000854100 [Elysia marginata]
MCRQSYSGASSQLVHPGKYQIKTADGFSYDSFNPRARPSLWCVQRMFEKCNFLGFLAEPGHWGTQFLDIGRFDCMIFLAAVEMRCKPELYDHRTRKQPVQVDSELVRVGNTSFKIRSSLFLPEIAKPVTQEDMYFVFIDKDTRKPTSPPSWWKEKYARYSQPNEGPRGMRSYDLSQAADAVDHEEFRVRSVDLDPYCHVNNAAYLRFCYETYVSSHIRKFGYRSNGDPFRNVRNIICNFKGDADFGDLLKVSFIEAPCNEGALYFQIVNGSKGVIFECTMEFFPQLECEREEREKYAVTMG